MPAAVARKAAAADQDPDQGEDLQLGPRCLARDLIGENFSRFCRHGAQGIGVRNFQRVGAGVKVSAAVLASAAARVCAWDRVSCGREEDRPRWRPGKAAAARVFWVGRAGVIVSGSDTTPDSRTGNGARFGVLLFCFSLG